MCIHPEIAASSRYLLTARDPHAFDIETLAYRDISENSISLYYREALLLLAFEYVNSRGFLCVCMHAGIGRRGRRGQVCLRTGFLPGIIRIGFSLSARGADDSRRRSGSGHRH